MKLTILYGSATGNAEHIARRLASTVNDNDAGKQPGLLGQQHKRPFFRSADVMEMNRFKRERLFEKWKIPPPPPTDDDDEDDGTTTANTTNMSMTRCRSSRRRRRHALVVVCSTTGNGDAPENASRFLRYVRKPPPPPPPSQNSSSSSSASSPSSPMPLSHLAYAVLALGDTNYDKFCEAGKVVDRKLGEWGGNRAMGICCADEATGLEDAVEPWIDGVLDVLARACVVEVGEDDGDGEGGGDGEGEGVRDERAAADDVVVASLGGTMGGLAVSDDNVIDVVAVTPDDATPAAPAKSPTPLYVLYGSATGNAEHIAKDLASSYESRLRDDPSFFGYFPSAICCELNQYKRKCLDRWAEIPNPDDDSVKHGVLIVCSTTGNADAPECADRFVRWIKRESTPSFEHVAYAVLGLGDSNYDVFNAAAKVIDRRMAELGGTRATKAAYADEATGLEDVVEPWVGSVVSILSDVCMGGGGGGGGGGGRSSSSSTDGNSASAERPSKTPIAAAPSISKGLSTSFAEEKKVDAVDEIVAPADGPSGVSTIRELLSIPIGVPLPTVPNAMLPTVVSSLSSCELIHDIEGNERRPRGDSIADNMTISSASSGFLFTANRPYESAILDARYLTATDVGCAAKVAGEILLGEVCDEQKLVKAMKLYEDHFPLSASTTTTSTTSGAEGDERQHRLRCEKNGKRVIEMTLSLPDDFTLEYQPGDSVGLIVPNAPQSTHFILAMLERNHGILPSQKISVDAANPITVEEAIRCTIDLCSTVKKKRLYLLSMHARDPEEERALRLLSTSNGNGGHANLYEQYVEGQRRTVVDILQEFPSCQSITLEGLLGCLPAIPPRYYSVCSSPLLDRQTGRDFHLKVAFSVVDYLTPSVPEDANSRRRVGGLATRRLECICSPYLSHQHHTASSMPIVHIFPKPTIEFRLPSDMSTPLVLIGPGTGIAPFIGFLSHRQAQLASLGSFEAAEMVSEGTWRGGYELDREDLALSKGDARGLNLAADYLSNYQQAGDIDLFFGCRHSDHDYLYKKELEEFKSRGILTNLFTAFSREEGTEKTYVQTLMQNDVECGKRLVEMIMVKSASVYVCGDGNAMGKDVQEAIVHLLAKDLLHKCKDMDEANIRATAHVDQMKAVGRFVLDIWS